MKKIDKSLLTNLVALSLIVLAIPGNGAWQPYLLNIGLFALSGALTNWLAVHMLFERVPGFYGSGVIPLRFEEFKLGIRKLIVEQFFNKSNLDEFFQDATEIADRLESELLAGVEKLDLDAVFEALVETIMQSKLGSVLGMFGGRGAVSSLKEPFTRRMKEQFHAIFANESFRAQLQDAIRSAVESDAVLGKLEAMIDSRLTQMTPQLVKEIIQAMIKQHLGWLVVWGGVLGGVLGLVVAVLASLQNIVR